MASSAARRGPAPRKSWIVRKPGAKRASSTHRTRKEAIAAARDQLRGRGGKTQKH